MRATGGGFTKLAKPVLVFEWRGISAKAPWREISEETGVSREVRVGDLPNTV